MLATVYSTVHEHTEKPVENISIVSSEALLSVKLRVYGIAKIRPTQRSRIQTVEPMTTRWDGLQIQKRMGCCDWTLQFEATVLWYRHKANDRTLAKRCVRTFNSTTLKMRVLLESTCIQARRMVKEALWWNLKSKQSRQWWSSIFSFFLVCWINRHSELWLLRIWWLWICNPATADVYEMHLLYVRMLFSWWNARWICVNICFEQGLHFLGA